MLFIPSGPWIDGVYWTLGIEIAFYALIFLLLLSNAFARIDLLAYALAALSGGFWLWWLASGSPSAHHLASVRLTNLLLIRHGAEFALGMLIWRCQFDRISALRGLGIATCVVTGLIEIYASALEKSAGSAFTVSSVAAGGLWLVALALIVLSIAGNATAHRWFGRHAGVIRAMGLATYPLYLLHQVIGSVAMYWAHQLGAPAYACVALATGVALGLAFLVALVVEPLLRKALGAGLDYPVSQLPMKIQQRLATKTSGIVPVA